MEKSRIEKTQDKELKSQIEQSLVHDNPSISHEKATATVFKLVAQKKLKDDQEKFYGVKEEVFKPDVSTTIRRKLIKKFRHDGTFHLSQAVNKEIWSCCGNENQASKGCIMIYKDLDKWQTLSY